VQDIVAWLNDLIAQLGGLAEGASGIAYLVVGGLVALDAIVPMIPGEAAVTAASILASLGYLDIRAVLLAGALGAIVGDSIAYAVGHLGRGTIYQHLIRLAGADRVEQVEVIIRRRRAPLIIFGRYIPVGRLLVNLSAGAVLPYRQFLPLSIIAGFLWSAQASLIVYFIGQAVDQPVLGVVISVAAMVGLVALLGALERKALGRVLRGDPAA
jgi:membrane protein DedA with SNARE-associated domain